MEKITTSILKEVYKTRPLESRKYDFGFLLVVGGSEHYTGSPALAGLAAFRAGVDMVKILAPKRAADIIASFSPNLATSPFEGKWFDKEDVPFALSQEKSIFEVAGEKAVLLIGGGLGRSPEVKQAVADFLKETSLKAVVDADAIHVVSKQKELVSNKNYILTPHYYEFFVLSGKEIKDLPLEEKAKVVQETAKELGCVILLKGRIDIISDGKEVALNYTGNAFMTVGGTGDTLAGIAGALLAYTGDPFLAAKAAAYINGKAGELAGKKFGWGTLATDVVDNIPAVIL
ncbi:NAD(P)H-hydrate dehydratase [bacterium (Candidatus Gribaldobacteria) CG10_big_fil_rev_8_21_14_0_10_37_21]|uniref:ADP-dependent (S)-NAD(P)H-hydrate dehydratase n=1 Tax=bacterium (Candidatus Gribaldobacteria) CG10_big_fil_rev_8_21_14_0_10_37_21 TaxID=2014275 RepID=A0A2H0UTI6_9BACT|nr:MAG: NAD(P)H-hydrate dehydratase [Parcubacteria group bacterium CG1_02_37_13]PIR89902.1 MAG: NAD(P)H-hydrate dehydratase [bacterium (Candidatus Gribaldobacteria) CG10_big_fil_rev_8_21_14_0_10_37_21]